MHHSEKRRENRINTKRLWMAVLIIVSLFSFCFPAGTYADSTAKVRIGHAVIGENGLKGNKPGNQTGIETRTEDWSYSIIPTNGYHWKYVLRAKDHDLARAIARHMEEICSNNKIGYDQNEPDCTTLYDEAKKKNWDIPAIKTKCETTCSNAVSVCLNAEGIKMPKLWNSSNMKKDLMKTDLFECFETKDYTKSSKKLLTGDILVTPGKHTAVVIESDNPFMCKLTYIDEEGNTAVTEIEENKLVHINPNNSTETTSIKMNKDRDITDREAYLKEHIFTGWKKTGTRSLTACYKPERQEMRPVTEKVKIRDQ